MISLYLSNSINQNPDPMLPLVTDTLVENPTRFGMIDQLIDNKHFCNNNPNSKPMTSNEFANKTVSSKRDLALVSKSYELNNNIIQESYFDTDGMENANEFVSDYANSYPNGVILVLNEIGYKKDADLLALQLKSELKYIIFCNGKGTGIKRPFDNDKQIDAKDISTAVKAAYEMVIDGQAILFQGVNKNFDLFSYLY